MTPETHKQAILRLFADNGTYTCQQLCKALIQENVAKATAHGHRYLSGSISSILKKLVDDGVLKRESEFGEKGGYGYKLSLQ